MWFIRLAGMKFSFQTGKSVEVKRAMWKNLTVLVMLSISVVASVRASQPEAPESYLGKTIRKVDFAGKFRLRRAILLREIDSRSGQSFDPAILDRDRKRIDSFGIFSKVEPRVIAEGDSVDVIFELREVWTLLPLLSIGRTDGKPDFWIGAYEKNLLGLYLQTALLYRRFEHRNSGYFSASLPRAFGKYLALGIALSRQREIDPLITGGRSVDYDYLRKAVVGSVGYRLSERVYVSSFVGYDRENWSLLGSDPTVPSHPRTIDYPRYSVGSGVTLGRVYSDNYFLSGVDFGTLLALINEQPGGSFNKWRLSGVARGYFVLDRFNLALRAAHLRSSADERVPPFAISGEGNIRGYADKTERGDQFLFANAELRLKVLDSRLLYGQVAIFTDAGAIWGRGKAARDAFSDPYWNVGGGIRGALRPFLGQVGRIDAALNTKTGRWEFYLSTAQFF